MARLAPISVALAAWLGAAPASAEIVLSGPFTHTGICEPSGAAPIARGSGQAPAFLVVNDEDNAVRIYASGTDGGPLRTKGAALDAFLSQPGGDDDKADLEGVTQIGDRIYVIGSHSRSGNKGKSRPSRRVFFSLRVTADGPDGFAVAPTAAKPAATLLPALVAAYPDLGKAVRLGVEEDGGLTPETGGLNIEGLASSPDGRSVLIGLRNPLGTDGRAWLLLLENPKEVTETKAKPRFGKAIPIDLGRRGVRSMEYSPADGAFFIMAGPAGSDGAFELFRWSGRPEDRPVPVPGTQARFAQEPNFQPEGMVVLSKGKLLLLSDDGDRILPNGKACKKQASGDRSFRSFILGID